MGQLISSSHDIKSNDQLVNYLVKRKYIGSIDVEKVFRCVDRGFYYTVDNNINAYRDTAWQSGKVHLSAPSVYAVVLENLELQKGQKFLNIGSGVGYLSTLAGLLLGVNGVNHGIEIHKSLIDIAHQKLEEFKLNSAAIDYFELCEPVFLEGNVCDLASLGYYDKVYCGAGVPPAESIFIKAFIKVGGILVMPLDGFLVKIVRQSENFWKTTEILEVTFADLVVPQECTTRIIMFPTVEPMNLQELCRSQIRASIRDCLNENSNYDLQMRTKCKTNKSCGLKFMNSDDPLSQFVRLQYGATEEGMISLRNIVDTFAGLDEAISDLGSTSGNDANDDDNNSEEEDVDDGDVGVDGDDEDDDDDEEKNDNEQCDKSMNKKTESDTKRKSSEAGCSEQNKTSLEKPENTKRMRMNTSSLVKPLLNSQSTTNSSSVLWNTMTSDSSSSSSSSDDDDDDYSDIDDSEGWLSSDENVLNAGLVSNPNDFGGRIYNSLFNGDYSSHDSDTDSDASGELSIYRFLSERKENELSKLLKVKIDLLPIPAMLKLFLNYDKED